MLKSFWRGSIGEKSGNPVPDIRLTFGGLGRDINFFLNSGDMSELAADDMSESEAEE